MFCRTPTVKLASFHFSPSRWITALWFLHRKGWNLRVHSEFSVSIRWNTVANAFGSSCAYRTGQTQLWAELSSLIRTGREQFHLQRKQSNTQRQGHAWLFSFGMIINLWQIPQLLAARSALTRKRLLGQWGNVPQRFTRFPVVFECSNYILFHAVCTSLSRWKSHRFGMSERACGWERKMQDGSAAGWSHRFLLRDFGGSNIPEICLISVTLLLVLLDSKRSPLAEMKSQISRMLRYLILQLFPWTAQKANTFEPLGITFGRRRVLLPSRQLLTPGHVPQKFGLGYRVLDTSDG